MLLAQITDVHLGFGVEGPDEDNARRLDQLVATLAALDVKPELLLATGDLADKGTETAYARLKAALLPLGIPLLPAIGNHDRRASFDRAFPDAVDGGFIQYVHALPDGRAIIVIDTLEEGRHGGAFCAARGDWLRARLDEAPDRPTIIALHHPPVETGIHWLTTDPAEPWIAELADAIAGRRNIVALIAGHVHRPIASSFAGVPLFVCPSVAPAVALEMAPVDPHAPDGRPMVLAAPPGFALHLWTEQGLVSHVRFADETPVLVRYDAAMQPLVRQVFDERPRKR